MAQVCTKCSHANPADAVYCFFDGALLQGHGGQGGPVKAGQMAFPTPFVFPNGKTCQNFDQLAMAFQNDWALAKDLLHQGFLVGFFGGLGRVDLAAAAREAAEYPDQDRGLDQLLAKLPTQALQAPKLKVEPLEINLGVVPMGNNRTVELHLVNQGMRLVYGSVASDSKWLTLGDPPGGNQKLFQFMDEVTIQVQIRGQHLRAGPKPLMGQLFLDSNGNPGNQQIVVKFRVDVPVRPFPEGVLAGATTPRQLAEKCRDNPKKAALLFENGAVPRWFAEHGWIYPVQGPVGSGLGAVQQFFEALGLAKAPRVMIDKQGIALQGSVGQRVQTTLKVETPEKRPVYAHATADEPWLDVTRTEIEANGRIVLINVQVPAVPPRPGETLRAKVRVAANGNQRFEVPVALTIHGTPGAIYAQPMPAQPMPAQPVTAQPILAHPVAAQPAAPAAAGSEIYGFADDSPPVLAMPVAAVGVPVSSQPTVQGRPVTQDTAVAVAGEPTNAPFAAFALGAQPAAAAPPLAGSRRSAAPSVRRRLPPVVHVLPLGLLFFCLIFTVIRDAFFAHDRPINPSDVVLEREPPRITIRYDDGARGGTMRFGVIKVPLSGEDPKKLTYDAYGTTNSTLFKVDGKVSVFGKRPFGVYTEGTPRTINQEFGASKEAIWISKANPKVEIVQIVERVPGEPFLEKGVYKRVLDTCRVRYEIRNRDGEPHKVALRFVLDTLIGDNDGVPFTVPGTGLIDTQKEFPTPDTVPDFIQALEEADLQKPGVVAQLNLKIGRDIEPPSRVLLTYWPGEDLYDWEIPLKDISGGPGGRPDSAVVMYWEETEVAPGKSRVLGFSYALGNFSTETGALAIITGGDQTPGGEFTVTALVSEPKDNQKLTFVVPNGLSLKEGSSPEQEVPPLPKGMVRRPSPVSWRVRAERAGTYQVEVRASTGERQTRQIFIPSKAGIFGGS